jgi:hypothetical protein
LENPDDLEVLKTLIGEENEFVFAAFDVFVSDRDEEEFLDTLNRCIAKFHRLRVTEQEPLNTSQFYPSPKNALPTNEPVEPFPNDGDSQEDDTDTCIDPLEYIIANEGLEQHLAAHEFGMLIELLNSSRDTISHIFDSYSKDRDLTKLVQMLKMICNYQFDRALRANFEPH